MSKRKKPANLYPVRDLAEANGVLAEIGALKRRKERIDQDLSDRVDQLKAEAEAKAAPILERIASLENGLLAFAEYNKADVFGERRSKELTHGVLGYRKSTEIATKSGHTLAMWNRMLQCFLPLSRRCCSLPSAMTRLRHIVTPVKWLRVLKAR